MLRAAQPVGMVAGKQFGDAALRPGQLAPARLPFHPAPTPARNAQDTAHSLDHDAARFIDACRHQRDPLAAALGQAVDPFRPRTRLAEAAPSHHQPHPPAVAAWRQLAVAGPDLERSVEHQAAARPAFVEERSLLLRAHRLQPLRIGGRELVIFHASPLSSSSSRSRSSRARMRSRASSNSASSTGSSAVLALSRCMRSKASATRSL